MPKTKRPSTHIFINLLLFLVTFFILFFVAETAFRFFYVSSFEHNDDLITFIQESDNPELGVELKPLAQGYIYDKKVEINERGERGLRVPYFKSSNVSRIVFIGDSVTFGFGNAFNETYSSLVEGIVNYDDSLADAQSINLGVYSYNTVQQIGSLKAKGLLYQPDVVIVGFFVDNPEGYYNRLDSSQKSAGFSPLAFVSEHSLIASKIIKTVGMMRNNNIYEQVYNTQTEQWRAFEKALHELANLSSEHDFEVIFVMHPLLVDLEHYPLIEQHEVVKSMAYEQGFIVVDMLDYYQDYNENELKAAKQDIAHPNYFANTLIADAIVEKLSEIDY